MQITYMLNKQFFLGKGLRKTFQGDTYSLNNLVGGKSWLGLPIQDLSWLQFQS